MDCSQQMHHPAPGLDFSQHMHPATDLDYYTQYMSPAAAMDDYSHHHLQSAPLSSSSSTVNSRVSQWISDMSVETSSRKRRKLSSSPATSIDSSAYSNATMDGTYSSISHYNNATGGGEPYRDLVAHAHRAAAVGQQQHSETVNQAQQGYTCEMTLLAVEYKSLWANQGSAFGTAT